MSAMPFPWHTTRPEAVAFDMDGTLLNSGLFGVQAISAAFAELIAAGRLPGLQTAPGGDLIKAQIGKPPAEFYRDLLPPGLQHHDHLLHETVIVHERHLLLDGTGRLFDGTAEVLRELHRRGHDLLLVSNCSQEYMDTVLDVFGLRGLFVFTAAAGRSTALSKRGELHRGLRRAGSLAAVMVGDRVHDGDAARACGAWFVGCTYGYGRREELAGADALIADIRELPALLG